MNNCKNVGLGLSKNSNDLIMANFPSKDIPSGHVVTTVPKKNILNLQYCKSKVAAKEEASLKHKKNFLLQIDFFL